MPSDSIKALRVRTFTNIDNLALILSFGICPVYLDRRPSLTANPIMIALGASMVSGTVIPELTVWLELAIGLLLGFFSAQPKFDEVTGIVFLLSMPPLILSLINIVWGKQRRPPCFIPIAPLLLVYAVRIGIIQWHSLEEFVAGCERYFQSFGRMMALPLSALKRYRKHNAVMKHPEHLDKQPCSASSLKPSSVNPNA